MSRDALHWFPGHMAKAMRRLSEDVRFADAVIEVVDARIPRAGANPALEKLTAAKPRVVVLTRADLADTVATKRWIAHFERQFGSAIAIDAKNRGGIHQLKGLIAALPGKRVTTRAVIAGVPNAGKSTVINALAGRKAARVEDRAGVTRAQQWIRVGTGFEVLDTAGILPARVERPEESWKLAIVGAVPRSLFEPEAIARQFHAWSVEHRGERSAPSLETFAQQRGLVRGGTIDEHNAAWSYLKDVGEGAFGRFTLDEPPP
jgi:ribosome biogenesis GTPase A